MVLLMTGLGTKWYKTQNGENCTGVASKNGITLVQL